MTDDTAERAAELASDCSTVHHPDPSYVSGRLPPPRRRHRPPPPPTYSGSRCASECAVRNTSVRGVAYVEFITLRLASKSRCSVGLRSSCRWPFCGATGKV